ncbi:MAG TPA: SPOR domain-containing protein [Sphingomicrobium sp.]|nr:SPOR domain-containing protein [Sphingomicrobium sp.]
MAAVIALTPAEVAAQSVRAGIDAWQRSDYAGAVAIWRPLAEKGDADAAFNLGQAYRLGRGVPIDLAMAQNWLVRAARANHLDAQTTLGLLLFDSGSRDIALQWLKRAAERGEPRALLVYGTALFNGDGVERDPVLAYAYVSRAAAQGLEPARNTLAELDKILPVEQRQKGVEIALDRAKGKSAPKAKPPKRTAQAPPKKQTQAEKPKPAQAAAPKAVEPAASGRWRIQLGAFSKRSSAEALFRKLSGSAPVAGHAAHYVPVGSITRLQVGGFATRAAAASACSALTSRGQACFPVEGK